MTDGSDAGEYAHASRPWLPDAPTTMIPSAMSFCIASLNATDLGIPMLMLATAGVPAWWWLMTQSIAG